MQIRESLNIVTAALNEMAAKRSDYPSDMFWLPPDAIVFYDDPHTGRGDDGWSIAELVKSIQEIGEIEMEIEVGMSVHDLRETGNDQIAAFNGNHRLAAAQQMKIAFILCRNSEADDAEPLTIERIVALGGRLHA